MNRLPKLSSPLAILGAVFCIYGSIMPLAFASNRVVVKQAQTQMKVEDTGIQRTVCGLTHCGYVYQTGTELGYEVYMSDFINEWNDQIPAPADTIHNLVWGIFGDVDEPSGCGGSIAQCGLTEYVSGCDEEATFHVYYYDASWNEITDYGFTSNEIGYATTC